VIDRARGDENGHLANVAGQRPAEAEVFAQIADFLRQRRVVHERGVRAAPHLAALGRDLVVDALGFGSQRVKGIG